MISLYVLSRILYLSALSCPLHSPLVLSLPSSPPPTFPLPTFYSSPLLSLPPAPPLLLLSTHLSLSSSTSSSLQPLRTSEQCPHVVSLLSESFNAHVRCGSAMALGIACAGTGSKVIFCALFGVMKLCTCVFYQLETTRLVVGQTHF